MSRSAWKRPVTGSTFDQKNSLQQESNTLRSMSSRSGAGPPSSEYNRSSSVGSRFNEGGSAGLRIRLAAERAGSPCSSSPPIHHRHPPPTQGYRRGASRTAVVTCPAADRESGPAPKSEFTVLL